MSSPKYNRTMHFTWSPGAMNDDRISDDISSLLNVPIVVSEKIDGSNTSLEADGCFSRTHSGPPTHPSFDGLKALHGQVKWMIPQGIQVFGEWVYAKHSIEYTELPGYFLLFNIRDLNYQEPIWYAWEEVQEWAQTLGVPTVPILYRGQVSDETQLQEMIQSLMKEPSMCGGVKEGVVVRVADSFVDSEFSKCTAKFVRAGHVQTSEHWKNQEIVRNKLKT